MEALASDPNLIPQPTTSPKSVMTGKVQNLKFKPNKKARRQHKNLPSIYQSSKIDSSTQNITHLLQASQAKAIHQTRSSLPDLALKKLSHPHSTVSPLPSQVDTRFELNSSASKNLTLFPKSRYGDSLNLSSRYNHVETTQDAFLKFRLKTLRNIEPSVSEVRRIEGLRAKGPSLEAVLNDFSRVRLKLPTIQSRVKRSVGRLMKDLPEQDKFSRVKNFYKSEKFKSVNSDNSSELNEDIERFETTLKSELELNKDKRIYLKHQVEKVRPKKIRKENSPEKPVEKISNKNIIIEEHDRTEGKSEYDEDKSQPKVQKTKKSTKKNKHRKKRMSVMYDGSKNHIKIPELTRDYDSKTTL